MLPPAHPGDEEKSANVSDGDPGLDVAPEQGSVGLTKGALAELSRLKLCPFQDTIKLVNMSVEVFQVKVPVGVGPEPMLAAEKSISYVMRVAEAGTAEMAASKSIPPRKRVTFFMGVSLSSAWLELSLG